MARDVQVVLVGCVPQLLVAVVPEVATMVRVFSRIFSYCAGAFVPLGLFVPMHPLGVLLGWVVLLAMVLCGVEKRFGLGNGLLIILAIGELSVCAGDADHMADDLSVPALSGGGLLPTPIMDDVDIIRNRRKRRLVRSYRSGRKKVGDLTPHCRKFDVVAESCSGVLKHISALDCNLMALQYPLLFPYGDKSYHLGINYVDVNERHAPIVPSVASVDQSSDDDSDCESAGTADVISRNFTTPHGQYGAPDLFITFTCNPKWKEIADALAAEPGQAAADRPDITTRVFAMKYKEFLEGVKDGSFFGPVQAYSYVVEFQKRGLPHTHTLVWLKADTKDPSPSFIDSLICAELPDPSTDPLGYALVDEFMFSDETMIDNVGFPVYRRRDNGRYVLRQQDSLRLGNQWVVPYNMKLLKKFDAHINVEWCNKTNLLKYLFKYLTKGPDVVRIRVDVDNRPSCVFTVPCPTGKNEIDDYVKCRYLSAREAFWRMFAYSIHGREPSIERLVVHLPNMNRVIFAETDNLGNVLNNPFASKTMLTEWFVANQEYTSAKSLTYLDFPSQWIWNKSEKVWTKRKLPRKLGNKIGRIYHVHPSTGELFFLRVLLMVVPGATCFEDLRTHNGRVYDTFKEACQSRGLVGDDNEWFKLFDEAIVWATPLQLRHLFMTVLLHCEVGNGRTLFERFWPSMAEDISYMLSSAIGNARYNVPEDYLQECLLSELASMFTKNGSCLALFNLTSCTIPVHDDCYNKLVAEELGYDVVNLAVEADTLYCKLNDEQRDIHHEIVSAVRENRDGFYFISGCGGSGKTFLWNSIIATLRSERRVVLAVASSGVASLLLPGGRTGHSRFKIPVDVNERSQCSISRRPMLAGLCQRASLILWDEAPMTSRLCFEALDRTLRDVLSVHDEANGMLPFGGKVMVLGGDFRQILPVVEGGTKEDIIGP
ncbi:uncharacterized protein [Aegilops tauschii subsp. strangulata]|uniref:uncharacterized protein n=1 Tax=Aegilops tauschii subsp. strangulata TaxID=200361 RepID=UPI003CC860BA